MPFRARLRRALGRSTSSSAASDSSSSTTPSVPGLDYRKDPTVYRPGEQMPRPKYRAPVEKKHKEMLESFDFINSWRSPLSRRGSHDWSGLSPHGSRLPSRSASRTPSRSNSFSGTGARPRQARDKGSAGCVMVENADEAEDLANVGISQRPSRRPSREIPRPATGAAAAAPETTPKPQHTPHSKHTAGNTLHHVGGLPDRTLQQPASKTQQKHDMPFSHEDLERALLRKVAIAEQDEDDFVRTKPDTL